MNIYESICATMADIGAIGKDTKNAQQGFMYRGVDAVMNALQPALLKNHIFVVPEVLEQTREERTTTKGAVLIYSICKIKYTFYAEDGTSVSAVVIGEGMDSGDKATNKAMSIAFKYVCFQVFCIPTEEMRDPDAEVHEVRPKTKPTTPKAQDVAAQKIGQAKINALTSQCEKNGINPEVVCEKCNVKEFADLTEKQFVWLQQNWSKVIVNGVQGNN